MFTGIVTSLGEVLSVAPRSGNLHRLSIGCDFDTTAVAIGASIACSGICLTVVDAGKTDGRDWFAVDAAAETLSVTTAGKWTQGTRVNLERALKMGDELGGHIVSGHVDGIATLLRRDNLTDSARLTLRAPRDLSRFIATKGSVALDGVSLTINDVSGDDFSVLIIPHTLQVTTLGSVGAGDGLNLEIDTLARYAARLFETRTPR